MWTRKIVLEFRIAFFVCFYLIGFIVPWEKSGRASTLWLAAATSIARAGWSTLGYATITVTLIALVCLAAGSSLRVWGHLPYGHAARSKAPPQPAGCGELRNPFYLGSCLVGLATSILMPPGGALFFLVASGLFLMALRRLCPVDQRIRPDKPDDLLSGGVQVDPTRPRSIWLEAVMAEFFPISYTLCFGILAWRYNAHILIRCLLLCFGLSLIFRAMVSRPNAGSVRRQEL
jgi:hypothetical protein